MAAFGRFLPFILITVMAIERPLREQATVRTRSILTLSVLSGLSYFA
ncbi:MAG: hypothetical protein V3S15_03155 [Woeseiaceae bacterium]